MRILHTNMHREWGGQPNRVLTTAIGLQALGHHVVVAGPRNCELVKRARAAGLEVFDDLELRSGMRPKSMLSDIRAMKAHLRQNQYDIVDTHGSQDTWRVFAALLSMAKETRPIFIRSRHNIFPVQNHLLNRYLYSHIDHVVTVSPQIIPLLSNVFPAERCTAIFSAPNIEVHRGLDAQAQLVRSQVRQELQFPADAFVIGVVGRLAPEKGHSYLIAAAPEIVEKVPTAQFVFVGQGRTRNELEAQISALGPDLADRFHVLGFRNDVPRLLRAFDVFVLPSTAGESLGTSILEAFLAGCSVVGTDLGGVKESVQNGITGKLVQPGNSAALAEAIVSTSADPEAARAMAQAGKENVLNKFTPEGLALQTDTLYRELLMQRQNSSLQ